MSKVPSELIEVQAWAAFLDNLEISLQDAEDLALGTRSGQVKLWSPPKSMPVLPESLAPRAQELLARHSSVVKLLEAARRGSQQQLQLLSMDSIHGLGAGPHFIDQRV